MTLCHRSRYARTAIIDPYRHVNQLLQNAAHNTAPHPSKPVEATTLYSGPYLRTHPKHVNCQVFQINTVRFCKQLVQRAAILSRKVWEVTLMMTAWHQGIRLCIVQLYENAANHILSAHEDVHVEQISKWGVQVMLKKDSLQFGTYCFLLRSRF